MDNLNNYLKNKCKVSELKLENLSKYEIELLMSAIINVDVKKYLNKTLSGYFFNLFALIMENKKNYDEAKKYYLMAVKKSNLDAMNNLGYYYFNVKKNTKKMEKCFMMAIEKGDSNAMNNLGIYYCNINIQYHKAKKYFLMAIKKNNLNAINNLGVYYHNKKKNYDKAKKYYLMAIKKNDVPAYHNFEIFVKDHNNYDSFINCHANLIKKNNFTFVDELNKFVDRHFNECSKYISKNMNVLHKHLNILKKTNFTNENYCVNCNKYTSLIKSNCNHHFCLTCNNSVNKCLICRQLLKN